MVLRNQSWFKIDQFMARTCVDKLSFRYMLHTHKMHILWRFQLDISNCLIYSQKKKIEESSSISNRDISIKGWHKMLLLHFQYFKSSRHKVNRTILQLTMYQIWIITEVVVLKFYPKIHIKLGFRKKISWKCIYQKCST